MTKGVDLLQMIWVDDPQTKQANKQAAVSITSQLCPTKPEVNKCPGKRFRSCAIYKSYD